MEIKQQNNFSGVLFTLIDLHRSVVTANNNNQFHSSIDFSVHYQCLNGLPQKDDISNFFLLCTIQKEDLCDGDLGIFHHGYITIHKYFIY